MSGWSLHRGKARQHEWIVTRNDVIRPVRERLQYVVAFQHVGHVHDERKRAAAAYVRPEMSGIRRQHDPAARRRHAHHLQTAGMAADQMQRNPWGDFRRAAMETHTTFVDAADRRDHIVHLEWIPKDRVTHAAARAEFHLRVLDMKCRRREQVDAAGMVEMHVGEHHIADVGRFNADRPEHVLDRRQNDPTRAPAGRDPSHARIDDNGSR